MGFKQLLTVFYLIFSLHSFAQVIQSAQPLELKKSSYYHTSLAAPGADYSQLVTFVADKENLTALRYNNVLFFTDSLTTTRPDTDYDFMAGYSYEGDKAVTVYWASANYTEIQPVSFDFQNGKAVAHTPLELALREETVQATFSANDAFYIITLPKNNKEKNVLRVYAFRNGTLETRTVDFSGTELRSISNKELTIVDILETYPIQQINTRAFNYLPDTAAKAKLYIQNGQVALTLDHNAAYTYIITLNLNDYSLSDRQLLQPKLDKPGEANSYLLNGLLYQLKLNDEQLALAATEVETGEIIKTYTAGKDEEISFKNSDLLSQTGGQRPKMFKDTRRFLKRLANTDVALTVYETPNDIYIMAGGVRNVMHAGTILLGSAMILAGGSPDIADELLDTDNLQVVYFESLFNVDFEYLAYQPARLAVDYLSEFMAANERDMQLVTVFTFGYDIIVSYYDAKAEQYIIRKFTDDEL